MPPSSQHSSSNPTTSATPSVWSDLPRRATVLLIGIPLVGVILARPLTAWLFFQGVHLLAAWEWLVLVPAATITTKDKATKPILSMPVYVFPLISCVVSNLHSASDGNKDKFLLGLMATACLYCLVLGSNNNTSDDNSQNLVICSHLLKGLLFLTIPLSAWNQLCLDFGATTYLLSVVWNCDTGALIFGRLSKSLLKSRIPVPLWLQRISPAKSVEGILGGLLLGCLTSVFWPFLWQWLVWFLDMSNSFGIGSNNENVVGAMENQSTWHRACLGLALSLLGIVGDLWESATKRQGGVKDSGKLLPGHGGILDRFDSSLLPALFYKCFYY